jgi:tetratricopeptide (TPR) repeat protein
MTPRQYAYECLVLLCLGLASVAYAVLNSEEPPRPLPTDPDYAAARTAFERADWQGVLDNAARVVARRPWDDDAYNLMGYAFRKLGNYRQALVHYYKALDLNPHHRGVLEYLGEAYVDLGCLSQAGEILARLETACKRLMSDSSAADWQSGCEAWQDLQATMQAYSGPIRSSCTVE